MTGPAPDLGPLPYPAHLECDAVVGDGGVVHVRPLHPGDRERYRDLVAGVSDQSAYYRYFSRRRPLRPEELDRFVTLDYRDRLALGVEVNGELIAVGQYDTDPHDGRVEVAFLVHDDHQGRGIGALLLDHLAAEARRQGIRTFYAETLGQNRAMLRVFAHAGLPIGRELDHGVWEIEMRLDAGPNLVEEQHEHRADAASLRPFLAPERVVLVVGPGWEVLAAEVLAGLEAGGFVGAVHVVHPTAASVGGRDAVGSIDGVGDPAGLAVVAVDPADLAETLDRCGEAGLRAALVVSPGPAPGDEVRERARRHGLRVLGPGSVGVVATHDDVRLRATTVGVGPSPGRVALVSQSGKLGAAILRSASELDLGVSAFVSFGEKVDVSSNDVLQYLEDDPGTGVVCLYLHSFGNPRKFARIARRVGARTPIVVVRSGGGAGVDETVVEALFRHAGLLRVDRIDEMLDVARVLAEQPLPSGGRVAVVGNGAGLVAMAADACTGSGLEVPPLLGELPNPIDLGERARPEELGRVLSGLLADGALRDAGADSLLVAWSPADDAEAREVADGLAVLEPDPDRPVLLAMLGGALGPTVPLASGGRIPVFPFPELPAAALGHVVRHVAWRQRESEPDEPEPDVDRVRAGVVVDAVRREGVDRWLRPEETAELLGAYGVTVIDELPALAGGIPTCSVATSNVTGWGQVLHLALGGVLAPLAPPAAQLVPIRAGDARRLVDESVVGHLLPREADAARDALVGLVRRLGRLAADIPELLSLSCDPVHVDLGGIFVTGARARLAPHAPPSVSIRRLR